jgi:hypothetical protein
MKVSAHEIQDFDDDGVADRIKDLVAILAVGDEPLGAQHRKMLGDVGLLQFELLNQGSSREFSMAQKLQNCDPGRVSERLEDVGFKSAEWILHTRLTIYLVVLFEVHAGVQAGHLVAVAVEHLGGDGAGEEAGVDAALVGLGPAGVVDVGVDVGVEAVFAAVGSGSRWSRAACR